MRDQERLARRAEELGFAALWVRDVPLRDPSFGDVGQVYDPWVYLGWIAAQTQHDRAGHRLDRAAAAPSAAHRQGGRLGRPALGRPARARRRLGRPAGRVPGLRRRLSSGATRCSARTSASSAEVLDRGVPDGPSRPTACFRERPTSCPSRSAGCRSSSPAAAGRAWSGSPSTPTAGSPTRAPSSGRPSSPRAGGPPWQPSAPGVFKPFAQSLYVDLADDPDRPPEPIHLGFRAGRHFLLRFLDGLRGSASTTSSSTSSTRAAGRRGARGDRQRGAAGAGRVAGRQARRRRAGAGRRGGGSGVGDATRMGTSLASARPCI